MFTNLHPELREFLESGESLLWSGRPKQGIILRTGDTYAIPFSLMWAGFAFFWEFTVIQTNAPFFFKLWGIPFVLTGLYIVFGRFFYDAWVRKNTIYGLTDKRVIIKSGGWNKTITSLNLSNLREVTLKEKSDGSGSIIFGQENNINQMFRGFSKNKQTPSFEMIPHVRKVYNQILELQNKIRNS